MKDKLEDLLYQSGLTAQGCWDELDDYARQGIEKFAELLEKEFFSQGYIAGRSDGTMETVRECANIVADAVDRREPASTYVDKIKQHFGVE